MPRASEVCDLTSLTQSRIEFPVAAAPYLYVLSFWRQAEAASSCARLDARVGGSADNL